MASSAHKMLPRQQGNMNQDSLSRLSNCRWSPVVLLFAVYCILQAVLQFKWETFAGRMVRFEFLCFLIWLIAFSVFMLVFQVSLLAVWTCCGFSLHMT